MTLRHSNPAREARTARAPYNFIPLPHKVVTVSSDALPGLDVYEGNTGWFDCDLVTCSPTYVRGMVALARYAKPDPPDEKGAALEHALEAKEARSAFYATDGRRLVEGQPEPAIPGSSLRGLLRGIVEIVSYGKMRWVASSPMMTFRAVAAPREDPLSEPYRDQIGPFSRKVRAGYLQKRGAEWLIQPALTPQQKGWQEQAAFLKVKERNIPPGAIPGLRRFDDAAYGPGYFDVRFDVSTRTGKRGSFTAVQSIGDSRASLPERGTLVCSGNMLETSGGGQRSPRRNHALVLERNAKASALPIDAAVVDDYRRSLTDFQREELWGGEDGCLVDGAPVFYLFEGGRVTWFGHTPNFRVPARNLRGRAATPADFVPEEIAAGEQPDLADALFGWVEGDGGMKGQRAGRVSVTDARFVEAKEGVWYSEGSVVPAVLAAPKATTFQHYLVQDAEAGHTPDDRKALAFYGSDPATTQIRGFKHYWHKGRDPHFIASAEERKETKETQFTRIRPVKPGVRFRFRVHFENLSDVELGALAWALTLPGEPGRRYRHKLGMGKPLGLGSVEISATLTLTDRRERYSRFSSNGHPFAGGRVAPAGDYVSAFERFILDEIGESDPGRRLAHVDRIRMLMCMLEWREGSAEWSDRTRYMLIEHPARDNEYKDRPVLPDPMAVAGERVERREEGSTELRRGRVKTFGMGTMRNFGFIVLDGERTEVFVHRNQLAPGIADLRPGDRVVFRVRPGKKGLEAYAVRLEGAAKE